MVCYDSAASCVQIYTECAYVIIWKLYQMSRYGIWWMLFFEFILILFSCSPPPLQLSKEHPLICRPTHDSLLHKWNGWELHCSHSWKWGSSGFPLIQQLVSIVWKWFFFITNWNMELINFSPNQYFLWLFYTG